MKLYRWFPQYLTPTKWISSQPILDMTSDHVTGRRGQAWIHQRADGYLLRSIAGDQRGTELGQGQDISVVLTKVDKGSKLGNYGAGLSI